MVDTTYPGGLTVRLNERRVSNGRVYVLFTLSETEEGRRASKLPSRQPDREGTRPSARLSPPPNETKFSGFLGLNIPPHFGAYLRRLVACLRPITSDSSAESRPAGKPKMRAGPWPPAGTHNVGNLLMQMPCRGPRVSDVLRGGWRARPSPQARALAGGVNHAEVGARGGCIFSQSADPKLDEPSALARTLTRPAVQPFTQLCVSCFPSGRPRAGRRAHTSDVRACACWHVRCKASARTARVRGTSAARARRSLAAFVSVWMA